jgi:hypothetical protein
VTASSTEGAGFAAGNVVDGDAATRWSSAFADPQWISVDLGSDDVSFAQVPARHVRVYGTQRATPYGYSLWEMEVYGT